MELDKCKRAPSVLCVCGLCGRCAEYSVTWRGGVGGVARVVRREVSAGCGVRGRQGIASARGVNWRWKASKARVARIRHLDLIRTHRRCEVRPLKSVQNKVVLATLMRERFERRVFPPLQDHTHHSQIYSHHSEVYPHYSQSYSHHTRVLSLSQTIQTSHVYSHHSKVYSHSAPRRQRARHKLEKNLCLG